MALIRGQCSQPSQPEWPFFPVRRVTVVIDFYIINRVPFLLAFQTSETRFPFFFFFSLFLSERKKVARQHASLPTASFGKRRKMGLCVISVQFRSVAEPQSDLYRSVTVLEFSNIIKLLMTTDD